MGGQSLPMLLVSSTRVVTLSNDCDVVDEMLHAEGDATGQREAGVRQFFEDKHEQRQGSLLRGRLDCYAEYLLSRYWDDFNKGESELVELIKQDLRSGGADT